MQRFRRILGLGDETDGADQPPPDTGRPVIAVGDIHGRDDLLRAMLARIEDSAKGAETPPPELVFLGDYVDRGEDSAAVLRRLMALQREGSFKTVCLMGNHERMLLDFLTDASAGPLWLHNGGLQTMLSFGVGGPRSLRPDGAELDRMRRELADRLGPDTTGFLTGLPLSHRAGNVFFCHAGADPGKPVDEQPERELLWRRPRAGEPPRSDGLWVVHGHTPADEPIAANGRIAIDTGAYFSGKLTAVRLCNSQVDFLST
ncbi:MAG: metallophosphoesterase family protein [Paracoccaceae bacterium]